MFGKTAPNNFHSTLVMALLLVDLNGIFCTGPIFFLMMS